MPQTGIPQGDRLSISIAAASIIAKVHRDRLMCRFHERFPQYGFDSHKGYATADHCEALRRYGPCPLHRVTFNGVLQGTECGVEEGVTESDTQLRHPPHRQQRGRGAVLSAGED
jgi:ribonuclease HII